VCKEVRGGTIVDGEGIALILCDGAIRLGLDDDAHGLLVEKVGAHAVGDADDDVVAVVLTNGSDDLHVGEGKGDIARLAILDQGHVAAGVGCLGEERCVGADPADVQGDAAGGHDVGAVAGHKHDLAVVSGLDHAPSRHDFASLGNGASAVKQDPAEADNTQDHAEAKHDRSSLGEA
jgi:hypothetical protein